MNQPYKKELPRGLWLYVNRLPRGLSDVELQTVLAECGIALPLECISIQHYDDGSSAKLSVDNTALADLFNWLFDGRDLGGKPLYAAPVTSDRAGAQHQARRENQMFR